MEELQDDDQFYDTREEISSLTDGASDSSLHSSSSDDHVSSVSHCLWSQVWTSKLQFQSVHQRRQNFLRWMRQESDSDLDDNSMLVEELADLSCETIEMRVDRITSNSGVVFRTSEGLPSSQFMLNSFSNDALKSTQNGAMVEEFLFSIKNLDDGTQYIVDELGEDGMLQKLRVAGSNQMISVEEFQKSLGSSQLVQTLLQKDLENTRLLAIDKKKVNRGWLRKLGSVACVVDNHVGAEFDHKAAHLTDTAGVCKVRVHSHKKRFKELSSLYTEQEFQAHDGAILTMKFSLDGKYVASGGKDGIVRVWQLVEHERSRELDILYNDPSCVYFKMNNLSSLASIDVDKQKLGKKEKLRRSSDSTCVILPPKIFQMLEKPLHEFQGHSGEILDLSWSKRGFLLSSSIDKTVRLWQVGIDRCLRVFFHNNYVTCVNFSPVNDDFFISGSIDGKVRIWEVLGCQVTDYIDIREIVTYVCYRPNGKGAIVGTMTGNCLFYDIIDNHLQLESQLCLQGKKKTPGKRITGVQFSPTDPSKVVVASADSLVCVLSGVDVLCRFKGFRSAVSQMVPYFTSDGKHIVSVSEDSNVCIWNYSGEDRSGSKAKNMWCCESFLSQNASIAIPWCGTESMAGTVLASTLRSDMNQKMSLSPDCFSLSLGLLAESLPKVSATWPEETLSDSSPMGVSPSRMCKSEYKLLRSACKGISNSHLWGLVIITAGWDGRIRVHHNYGLPIRV
ncbi:hypothetical protein L6164_028359 [Bauhinia variegata]|uniref:Uncharacterized protein n=1 Tax=Bauhinia variegata TaxID=167791 RepID=A0ACB9LY98_BAUVA|nr:hypothetical protein L6164_028359 [Bauhinia variegata]